MKTTSYGIKIISDGISDIFYLIVAFSNEDVLKIRVIIKRFDFNLIMK